MSVDAVCFVCLGLLMLICVWCAFFVCCDECVLGCFFAFEIVFLWGQEGSEKKSGNTRGIAVCKKAHNVYYV